MSGAVSNLSVDVMQAGARLVEPGTFELQSHYYPRVLNAQLHPLVRFFMGLSTERIVKRYCHLHPRVRADTLTSILTTKPKFFRWGGADLFHVTSEDGRRRMIVVETNSCPSGNKSMPLRDEEQEQGGYRQMLSQAFLPQLKGRKATEDAVAVLFDKNYMEASGYAATLADLLGRPVWLAPFKDETHARFKDGVLEVTHQGKDHKIGAAFRYVTQKPWSRIPVSSKTLVFNPTIACLAGGRNKLIASKAYEFFNAEISQHGLLIHTPETVRDVRKEEISLWLELFGGHAVVKVPYSNAGQGVYTITSHDEFERFMKTEHEYDDYIVQALVGNHLWSSVSRQGGRLYHVGTMPNKNNNTYVADLRMMVCAGSQGFRPVAIYARRARQPLSRTIVGTDSWDVLGTNLSVKREDGGWDSESGRLILMDHRDFNTLGIGLDNLIDGFVQTVLSVHAIDKMAARLLSPKRSLRKRLFKSLNGDAKLMQEIKA